MRISDWSSDVCSSDLIVNPSAPTRTVPYVCSVPRSALSGEPAKPVLYGHGLLGSRNEAVGGSTRGLRSNGYMPCAVDWAGMATGALLNVATLLQAMSQFPGDEERREGEEGGRRG